MLSIRPWLLLVLAGILACKSEGSAANPWAAERKRPAPTAEQPFPRPMLWTATKHGKVMHLFGTLHDGIDVTKRLPPWIWTLFDASTLLVQELDIQALAQASWAPETRSLREELGADDWKRVLEVSAIPDSLDKERTSRVTLIVGSVGAVAPDPLALPMDAYFLQRARKLNQQLLFLETSEFQTAMLEDLIGIDTLRAFIRNLDVLRKLNLGYYDAYLIGDQDGFCKISLDVMKLGTTSDLEFAHYVDRMLCARNRAWIPQLEKAHAEHPSGGVFVTVGALHLIGPTSVLELLRARGFTIAHAQAP